MRAAQPRDDATMPTRSRPAQLCFAAIAALTLLTASCGSSGDSATAPTSSEPAASGDVEAFCDLLREAEDDDTDFGEDTEAVLAEIAEMRALAPEELRDDIDVLAGVFEEFAEFDEDDPEAFGAIFGLFLRPDVLAATERLEEFGVETCGLEPSDSSDDFDFDEDFDVDEDFDFDFDFDEDSDADSDDVEEDGLTLDTLQDEVEDRHGDESWAGKLSSWFMVNADVTVGPFGEDLTEDEAFAACDAISEIVLEFESNSEITVADRDGDAVVMRGRGDPACTHA